MPPGYWNRVAVAVPAPKVVVKAGANPAKNAAILAAELPHPHTPADEQALLGGLGAPTFERVTLALHDQLRQDIVGQLQANLTNKPYQTDFYHDDTYVTKLFKGFDRSHKTWTDIASELTYQAKLEPTPHNVIFGNVKLIRAPYLWQRYEACRNRALAYARVVAKAAHSGAMPSGWVFPVIDRTIREQYLFTGFPKQFMPAGSAYGLNPDDKPAPASGDYGALGKGIYFTDRFAKAITYAPCKTCGQLKACACTKVAKSGAMVVQERVLVLARVILGPVRDRLTVSPSAQRRSLNDALQVQAGTASSVKGKKTVEPGVHITKPLTDWFAGGSTFDSNEYIVRRPEQVYPEFLIYFQYTG